jgi:hypothetical protein
MNDLPPKLFDRAPRTLFGPLGDGYAELYWEVLATLYAFEFEREPFMVTRPTAVEAAEHIIRESPLWAARRQELESLIGDEDVAIDGVRDEATVVRALARRLIGRVERSGWVHFQYRSGMGEILSFHPYAARILETLLRIARDEQPIFQGFVHSIAALLDSRTFVQRPGVSLSEAKRHAIDLVRELKILERNIHVFTQRILDEAATAANVLEEGLERYEQAVMANYHRLKTVDNVYRQRSAILDRLDMIERDDLALDEAAAWYAIQRGFSKQQGRANVLDDLALLRAQFDAIPRIIDDIDIRNSRFSGAALQRIRYLLRQDRRTEGRLQFIVHELARGGGPEFDFDVYRCELLADGFLYTPPTDRPRPKIQRLSKQTEVDGERIRKEAARKVRRMFNRRRVEEFVDEILAGRQQMGIEEVPVETDDEYIRLLYLASYGIDRNSPFRFTPSAERVRKGRYGHPAGRIEHK